MGGHAGTHPEPRLAAGGAGRHARVGLSLEPGVGHGLVVRADATTEVVRRSGPRCAASVLAACLDACLIGGVAPRSIAVDVSRVLEDLVTADPRRLTPVALVRVVPRAPSDPALARHPSVVIERLVDHRAVVPGGHDLLGRELCPLDRAALAEASAGLAAVRPASVAVIGAGSQRQPRHEREVADALQAALPDARIAVANEFGGHGLAARETTVVLDAALVTAVDGVLAELEEVLAARGVDVPLRVARGDGGWVSAEKARDHPVLVVGAWEGLQVLGAAHLAGVASGRVLLPAARGHRVGGVLNHLVVVRAHALGGTATELLVPTAALGETGADPPGVSPVHPHAERDAGGLLAAEDVVVADRPPDELACTGVAVTRPMSWLDEIVLIESADQLEEIRRDAVARATALVMANGAEPGEPPVVEVSTVALPYSRSGMVRLRVRVAGHGDAPAERYAS